MIDDRWSPDADELGSALRRVLDKHCTSERIRTTEAGNGVDEVLDQALGEFGIWNLTSETELLVRTAYELGRALAASPFISAIPALALLQRTDVTDGVDRSLAGAGLSLVAQRDGDGVALHALTGAPVRTAAGELAHDLRQVPADGAIPTEAKAREWISWGWLTSSAALVGAAEALLAHTVEYVSQRRQFGQPVGAFQGVAFPLADAATAVRGADLLVRKTTYLATTDGTPPPHFAAMAAHAAKRASRQAASAAHQAMGGQGFTLEADTQLYSRRIRAWSAALPDPAAELATLARSLADPATRESVTDLWQFDRGFELPLWAQQAEGSR